MSEKAKITACILTALVSNFAVIAAAQESASQSSNSSDTKSEIKVAPAIKRLIELQTGTEFALQTAWKKQPGEGMKYISESPEGTTTLTMRFPVHSKNPVASAEELRDQDLKQSQDAPEWKKEHRKRVDPSWEIPALPDNIAVISNGVEGNRGNGSFLIRNFYLTSPVSGVIAISCESSLKVVNKDDLCMSFVKSAKLMPADERQRRLAAQQMVDRLYADSRKDDVPCSKVNDENKEYRSYYPNAKLEAIPRFQTLNNFMMAVFFDKFGQVKPDKLKEYLDLMKEVPVKLKALEDECLTNPNEAYADAATAVFKTIKTDKK